MLTTEGVHYIVADSGAGKHRVTTLMDEVPTAYHYLLARPDFNQGNVSSLRSGSVGRLLPRGRRSSSPNGLAARSTRCGAKRASTSSLVKDGKRTDGTEKGRVTPVIPGHLR